MSPQDRTPRDQDREPLPERLRKALDEVAEEEPELETKERNAGIAIAVLAILVILLFVAIISGATDAYQP